MGLIDPNIGYNSVTEFMGSGLPWVTSSIATGGTTYNYQFKKITKRVFVWNHSTGSHLRVGFTKNGIEKANYFLLDGGQTFEFDARIKEIFVRSDNDLDSPPFSIYAELIGINATMMPTLTGSIDGTVFWEGVG